MEGGLQGGKTLRLDSQATCGSPLADLSPLPVPQRRSGCPHPVPSLRPVLAEEWGAEDSAAGTVTVLGLRPPCCLPGGCWRLFRISDPREGPASERTLPHALPGKSSSSGGKETPSHPLPLRTVWQFPHD